MVHMNNSREKYRMENTDVVSYDDIRAVRKFYVQILMGMEQSHVFDIGILHKATSEIENFSSSKKQDYLALLKRSIGNISMFRMTSTVPILAFLF